MTVYQLAIYSTLNTSTVDVSNSAGTCKAQTVIHLVLANAMVDLAACLSSTLGFGFAIFLAFPQGYESLELRVVNICNWVIRCIFLLTNIALMVAMSTMVWGAQCSILASGSSGNYFYQYMTVLLILEWIHPLAIIMCAAILVGVTEIVLRVKAFIDERRK